MRLFGYDLSIVSGSAVSKENTIVSIPGVTHDPEVRPVEGKIKFNMPPAKVENDS